MPKKIGLHAFHMKLYMHEFFEPILFLTQWTKVHGQKGNLTILKASKMSEISATGEAMPTKIGLLEKSTSNLI